MEMSTSVPKKSKRVKATTQSTSISTREYEGNELIVDYGSESSRDNGHEEETDSSLPVGVKRKQMADVRKQAKPTNLMSALTFDEPILEEAVGFVAPVIIASGPEPQTGAKITEETRSKQMSALREQVNKSFMSNKDYPEWPSTYYEVDHLYSLLHRSILRGDAKAYGPWAQLAYKTFDRSQCGDNLHNELSKDDRKEMLTGFFLNFIKSPPNALWMFLPYVGDEIEGITFITHFKRKDFVLHFLKEFHQHMTGAMKVGSWFLDPEGHRPIVRDFLSSVGADLLQIPDLSDELDERISLSLPVKKKEKSLPSIGNKEDAMLTFDRTSMIVHQALDCSLKDLDKKSIDAFLDSIRKNRVQFSDWTFNRKLLSPSMTFSLNNAWVLYGDFELGLDNSTWLTITDDEFVSFMERIASSKDGQTKRESIVSELNNRVKGLFFDPLHCLDTLNQLVSFQEMLSTHNITLTVDEMKHIDTLTVDGIVPRNCCERIRGTLKAIKSTLTYSDDVEPFSLLTQAVKQANIASQEGRKLLNFFDVSAWEKAMTKSVASKNASDNASKEGNKNKRSSTQSQDLAPKATDKACNACGTKGHFFDHCRLVKNPTIDRSLLNLNKNIPFAESARGKYLVSQGYPPRFKPEKILPVAEKPDVTQASKKQKPNGK